MSSADDSGMDPIAASVRRPFVPTMVVTVRYVFGLGRGPGGGHEVRLEVPGDTTVFGVMQRLGVSGLELHAAVNGESAPDGRVLRDGDEVTLIPAIQGGAGS